MQHHNNEDMTHAARYLNEPKCLFSFTMVRVGTFILLVWLSFPIRVGRSVYFTSRFLLLLFLLGAIKAGHAILIEQVNALRLLAITIFEQRFRLYALLVEVDDIEGTTCTDGDEVGRKTLVGRIGDLALEYV